MSGADQRGVQVSGLAGAEHWGQLRAFAMGTTIVMRAPGFVLTGAAMGYGALARDSGLDLGLTVFLMAVLFALPAQIVLIDQIARGAALIGAAFAVALTAIRLLPMTVSLIPFLRHEGRLSVGGFLATHFVASSTWIEGSKRLPLIPTRVRVAHFIGLGCGMLTGVASGSAIGFFLADALPPLLSAAFLLMSICYLLLSLIGNLRAFADWVAVGSGLALGPLLYLLVPGFDLLLAGVIGGTIAFLASPHRHSR